MISHMLRRSRKKVGIIGLGIIGSRVAAALREAGFHVYVWNRSPRPEPNFLGSAPAVAEACEIIQIFVSDGEALFDVVKDLAPKLTEKHVVICSATVGLDATLAAAKLVEERGAGFLDAPFTGSKEAAEKRSMVYYVAGKTEIIQRAEPVLKASGRTIVPFEKVGQAAQVKVVTNMIAASLVQALAEGLTIIKRSGLTQELLQKTLEHHAVRSPFVDAKLAQMMGSQFDAHFSVKHMLKDMNLGLQMAHQAEVDVPLAEVTTEMLLDAMSRGWADLDYSAVIKNLEADSPEPESLNMSDTENLPEEILPEISGSETEEPVREQEQSQEGSAGKE